MEWGKFVRKANPEQRCEEICFPAATNVEWGKFVLGRGGFRTQRLCVHVMHKHVRKIKIIIIIVIVVNVLVTIR